MAGLPQFVDSSRGDAGAPAQRGFLGLAAGVKRMLGLAEDGAPTAGLHAAPIRTRIGREARLEPQTLATVAAGRLNLMGLAEIREELGPRWDELAEKVQAIAEKVVAKHLVPGDVFERHGDDSYILLFANLTRAEAEFKCLAIRNEIGRQLLGTEWSGLSKLHIDCVEIDKEALAGEDLHKVFGDAFGVTAVSSAPCERRPPGVGAEPARRSDASPPWTETEASGRGRGVMVSGASHVTDEALPSDPAAAEAPAHWAYTPVWDFEQMNLIRFRLTARTALGSRVHPCHAEAGDASESRCFENDLACLDRAVIDLAALSASGRRLAVICPIHHSSLTRGSWANLLIRQATLAKPSVRRLLTIEICGPTTDLGAHSVRSFLDLMNRIGIACSGCFTTETASTPPADVLLKTVSLELPQSHIAEASVMATMAATSQTWLHKKAELGVYGLSSRSLVVSAASSGFRFLAGDAVHRDVLALDQAVRFDVADLYREFQAR